MKTRNLTFNEAIEEHRKMWAWITENLDIEKDYSLYIRFPSTIMLLIKTKYFEEMGIPIEDRPKSKCFCCQYNMEQERIIGSFECKCCPIKWHDYDKKHEDFTPLCLMAGSYIKLFLNIKENKYSKEEIGRLCLEIANLPINEEEFNRVKIEQERRKKDENKESNL